MLMLFASYSLCDCESILHPLRPVACTHTIWAETRFTSKTRLTAAVHLKAPAPGESLIRQCLPTRIPSSASPAISRPSTRLARHPSTPPPAAIINTLTTTSTNSLFHTVTKTQPMRHNRLRRRCSPPPSPHHRLPEHRLPRDPDHAVSL